MIRRLLQMQRISGIGSRYPAWWLQSVQQVLTDVLDGDFMGFLGYENPAHLKPPTVAAKLLNYWWRWTAFAPTFLAKAILFFSSSVALFGFYISATSPQLSIIPLKLSFSQISEKSTKLICKLETETKHNI